MRHKMHLLTDAERHALIDRVHRLHVKRLVVGAAFIGLGMLLPEFRPHVLHGLLTETAKGTGFIPVLKLIEETLFA